MLAAIVGCRRSTPLLSAPKRTLAARLSYAALDRYRPLDDDPRAREPVPLALFAQLAERGDEHGVGDLALLAGDRSRATESLARAPHDLDSDADRAAAALINGDLDDALERLDAVLRAQPRHGQALWNRGLALAALELPLAAAQSFDAVAELHEPGWSDEARRRSAQLTASWNNRSTAAAAAIAEAKRMVSGGAPPSAELTRRFPTLVRHYFYHAARAAPSRERLAELRATAALLDEIFHEPTLVPFLDRIAKEAPAARAELAPRYGRYVLLPSSPPAVDPAELAQFFSAIERAGDDDLRLASLILFARHEPADRAQLARLVARNGDPWWQSWQAEIDGNALAAAGNLDGAAQLLESAIAACETHRLAWRCANVQKQLALVDQDRHRTSDARRWALAAIKSAQTAGMLPRFVETSTVFLLGEIARYRNDFSLMRAYLAEGMLRVPDNCDAQRHAHLMLGIEDVFKFAFDAAEHELAATPRCNQSFQLLAADLTTSLFLAGHDTPQARLVPADLEALRPSLTPSQRLIADALQARLSLARDRPAALALLSEAIKLPRTVADADAKKARTFAYQMLSVDAGRRGDFGAALDTLAAEAGAAPGERCALGVALDDARAVVAARTADGSTLGHYDAARARPEIDAANLVPPSLRARLQSCAEISVYALAPVHGQPELLPPSLAWSYRMGRAPLPPLPPGAPRRLIISDVQPPPSLNLPPLFPWSARPQNSELLAGANATPAHALAALDDAGEIEFNAHGLINLDLSDTWLLALSPDANGQFALTASDIERHRLRGEPLVVLAACYAGRVAPYLHEPWSLPMAFIDAGARAVFASADTIPDAGAARFFDAVLARVRAGQSAPAALRDERAKYLAADADNWTRHVLVFQ